MTYKTHLDYTKEFENFERCLKDKNINANAKAKIIKDYIKEYQIVYKITPNTYNKFISILKTSSYQGQIFTFINVAGDSRNLPFLKFLESEDYILLTKVDIEAVKQPDYEQKAIEKFREMKQIQDRIDARTGFTTFFLNTKCMRNTYFDIHKVGLSKVATNNFAPIKIARYDIERDPKLFENVYMISWKQRLYLIPSLEDTIPQGLAQLYINYLGGEPRNEGFEFLDTCLFVDELTRFKHPHFFIVYDETSNRFLTLDKALKLPDFIESYIYGFYWFTHENGKPKLVSTPIENEQLYGACTLGGKKLNMLEKYPIAPTVSLFTNGINYRDCVLTKKTLDERKAKKEKEHRQKEEKITEAEKEAEKKAAYERERENSFQQILDRIEAEADTSLESRMWKKYGQLRRVVHIIAKVEKGFFPEEDLIKEDILTKNTAEILQKLHAKSKILKKEFDELSREYKEYCNNNKDEDEDEKL